MGINTQQVSVDITKKTAPQIIRLGQGDKNGTTISARIYNDGAEYPMTGKTARFCMRTPDGKASYSVNNSSTSGNLVTFNINEQYAASVAGKTDVAYIEVLSGSTVICSTSRISVVIYRSASEGLPVSGAYSDALEEAIHSASTAASSANSAASNANTKATRAENAATAASNATESVNAAKDAANAAASAATTAAGSATTAAEAANSAKDAASAAATAANTAAGSANAATSEANAAIEAMGDISELAVPEMTANVRGGAKVGGSTQVIGGKLEVKLSESATGTSVTTGSTSALRELQVHGRSVQDGTPTPDAPVPVQVVSGKNLLDVNSPAITSGKFIMSDGSLTNSASWNVSDYISVTAGEYVLHGAGTGSTVCFAIYDSEKGLVSATSYANRTTVSIAVTVSGYVRVCWNNDNADTAQLERGTTPTPYVPYGSIGIVVGDTATSIDLQGNVLASLPAGASVLTSGARDVLRVDSAGHTTADIETGIVVFDGSDDEGWGIAPLFGNQPYTTVLNNVVLKPPSNGRAVPMLCNRLTATAPSTITTGTIGAALTVTGALIVRMGSGDADLTAFKADLASNPLVLVYPLATPQTIDLGYIDPPAIPSGSVVTVSASLTPTFDLDCWTEHASELADMPNARIPEFGDGLVLDGDTLSVDLETANGAVTTGKIADNAITTGKIADNAISTDKIVDDAITTDKIADDSITADKLDDKIILTEPSFRCVDRFIYGDIGTNGVSSAQAGCVFTQDGVEYWAQILNSDTTDQDVLVIRNIQNQQQVVSKTFELGHGYSLTYNPTTKQLMTENTEVSPMQIIIINVNTITNPYIEETIALGRTPVDNPFWYGNFIAGFQIAGGSHDIVVMDKNQTVIKRMPVDFYDTFHFGQGFVFQSAQYFEDTGEYYIGMTQGDGIAICEEINDNVVMKNYIPCKDYYSFIYMRELEFAYRNGDKLYINTYDEVDELLVPALLVWDMKHGTIQAENSWRIQHSGNIGFTVDYDNSSLIPGVSNTFKLAGDALRAARSCGHVGSVFIIFNSDYPHVFKLEGHEVTINATSPRNIKGIHGVFSQLRIENAGNFTFETSILLSEPYYAGIYLRDSTLSISDTVIPHRDNDTTNHFTIIAEYSTCHLENVSASDLYIMCRRSALFLATADQVSGTLVKTFVSGVMSKNV